MIRVERDGEVFEIKDFLVKLYIRNGFRVVTEKSKEEPKAETPAPKKTTRRTKKTQ